MVFDEVGKVEFQRLVLEMKWVALSLIFLGLGAWDLIILRIWLAWSDICVKYRALTQDATSQEKEEYKAEAQDRIAPQHKFQTVGVGFDLKRWYSGRRKNNGDRALLHSGICQHTQKGVFVVYNSSQRT